jgi:hypothetical protein
MCAASHHGVHMPVSGRMPRRATPNLRLGNGGALRPEAARDDNFKALGLGRGPTAACQASLICTRFAPDVKSGVSSHSREVSGAREVAHLGVGCVR